MIVKDLKLFLLTYLAILCVVLFLAIRFRRRFQKLFGSTLFPLILGILIVYNIISYPSLNWFVIFPSYQGPFQRLPSNELISLYDAGSAKAQIEWIYSLIEIYYPGKTLGVPKEVLGSLDLSAELLQTQGRLAEVVPLEFDSDLTVDQVDLILAMEFVSIRLDDGNIYYFVTEETDSDSYLLLLKHGNQLIFVPKDLLPEREMSL
jgi:hypothetical protein